MTLKLGPNIEALRALNQLNRTSASAMSAMQRLSSGLRINSAQDDPAGLALTSKLDASARVYSQAVRNANDGLSVLGVADSAVQQLSSILSRQSELATHAANGSVSTAQRTAMQREANQLTAEYNRIVATTSFNGVALLDGSGAQLKVQVGQSGTANSQITLNLPGAQGTAGPSAQTASSGAAEVDTFDFTNLNDSYETFLLTFDGDFSGFVGGGPGAYFTLTTADGIGNQSNYYVWVNSTVGGGPGTNTDPNPGGTGIEVLLDYQAGPVATGAAIAAALGGIPYIYVTDNGDGTVEVSAQYVGDLPDAGSPYGYVSLDHNGSVLPGNYFEFSTPGGNYYAWFYDNSEGIGVDPGVPGRTGIVINYGRGDSATAIRAAAISAIQAALGGTATVSATAGTYPVGLTITNLITGAVTAPNVSGMSASMDVTRNTVGAASDVSTGADTITFNSHGLTTGQTVTLSSSGGLPGGLSSATTYYVIAVNGNTLKFATSLANAQGGIGVNITSTGTGTITMLPDGTGSGAVSAYLSNLDLSTQSSARNELGTIATQLTNLSASAGNIGAASSRLLAALSVAATMRDAMYASSSRIKDADIAQEAAILVRDKIRQQAAAAVLAQANQTPALVLMLLG